MKILYLLFSYTVGGTEKLVTDICNEFVERGDEVHLYVVNDLYDEQLLRTLDQGVIVELYRRPVNGKGKIKAMIDLAKYIKVKGIEVVHCNSFNTPEIMLLAKLVNRRLKVVYTIHGLDQYNKLNNWRVKYRNWLCHTIVAISKTVEKEIIFSGANRKKVKVVYNAISLEKFKNNICKPKEDDVIILGNVARIDLENKGQDLLIRAVAELNKKYKVKCYFAGAADQKHIGDYEQLRGLVRENNLEDQIVFEGNVTDIPQFLKKIDVFVLPSRREGFGISLIEAMAMEIPCISSDINGPREIVGDEERGILFKSEDYIDLARAIERVILSYDTQIKKAQVASEYVKCNFDIKHMCDLLYDIYK
ncbi:MAG: glycosyltransferase [Lachnospiraceae bacterium]|nr:glycosyltransferase [Lachnospiraceae bacterium]